MKQEPEKSTHLNYLRSPKYFLPSSLPHDDIAPGFTEKIEATVKEDLLVLPNTSTSPDLFPYILPSSFLHFLKFYD